MEPKIGRVFVTGATGFIGEVVVAELVAHGHRVLGLARSDASAEKLVRAGAEVHSGSLEDRESLQAGARACDGTIHLAFIHDFSTYQRNAEIDRQASEAIAAALDGTDKPFLTTSGTAVLPPGAIGREGDAPAADGTGHVRAISESVLRWAERGVRVSAVRLPPTVHGAGDRAFVPALIGIAREKGVSAFIGEGGNRWPAVHRTDAARLYRLALEFGAAGVRWHGVADEGVTMREIAETIGTGLGVPVAALTEEAAREHFGWMAMFVGLDNPTSSAGTRETLGWVPEGPGLLGDLREGGYF